MSAVASPKLVAASIAPPADLLALARLSRVDYADAFSVEVPGIAVSGERWARAALEDARPAVRAQLVAGWIGLGLPIRPWESERVLGWRIAERGPSFVTLAGRSPLGLDGRLVFAAGPRELRFATVMRLHGPLARAVWSAITARHQQVVATVMTSGARRLVG